tara:strand:- start:8923 stop:10005 length:1083 start_codon:yes stop_codon:yes gene_type:complete
MEFFNKKEEVIDLQLTQYGKYLLSLGKFKPTFYAFYDENVLYDSQYGGYSEEQNDSEGRIQNDTPNLKVIHNFHSIEDDLARAVETKASGDPDLAQLMLQQTADKSQVLVRPLANSELSLDKAPAWQITLFNGNILTGSTTSTLTLSSSATVLNIPQIEAEIESTISISTQGSYSAEDEEQVLRGSLHGLRDDIVDLIGTMETIVFEDGSYFTVNTDEILLQVVEKNVPMGNDNFEIEIYEVEDIDGNGKIQNTTYVTELKQLRMLVERELVVNGILLDETEKNNLPPSDIDNSFFDYFFDMEADYEISPSLICEVIDGSDLDEYKFARKDFSCPDQLKDYGFSSFYSQRQDSSPCGDSE